MSRTISELYTKTILNKTIAIPMNNVGKNINSVLTDILSNDIGGKCIVEGFVKPDSINILLISNGLLYGSLVKFNVTFECLICLPVIDMNIECIVTNITKAGIKAISSDDPSPIVVFIARDHYSNFKDKTLFTKANVNDTLIVKVIGQRFELNDTYITLIAEII